MTKNDVMKWVLTLGLLVLLVVVSVSADLTDGGPIVSGISPPEAANNLTPAQLTITGVNFNVSTLFEVHLSKAGQTNISAYDVYVSNAPTEIKGNFSLSGAQVGPWNLTVVNMTSGLNDTLSEHFNVIYPAPTLISIEPTWYYSNKTDLDFTLEGADFLSGARVNLTNSTGYMFNADAVNVNTEGNVITCTLNTRNKVGDWNVSVNNTDGQKTGNKTFTLYNLAPTITSVDPLIGYNNDPTFRIYVHGSDFNISIPGSVVTLINGSTSIPINGPVFSVDSNLITFTADLNGLKVGSYNITVNNTGPLYNNTTWTQPFQVFYPYAPVVDSVTPNTHLNTTNTSVVIKGSQFMPGVSVWLNRTNYTDISAESIELVDSANITCNLITNGTLAGPWHVKVVNNDTRSSILNANSSFTITSLPANITHLQNTTYLPKSINWNWTDPISASSPDFSKVMIYINGEFQTNVTKGYQNYTASGLNPSTAYTISTHTVGTSGVTDLINPDWVNLTSTTAPEAISEIGVFQNGFWFLDFNGNGTWDGAAIDRLYYFGPTAGTPEVGDWSGTDTTKVGAYQNGAWYLDYNGNGVWDPSIDKSYSFGATGWTPTVGDWSATGTTKIGVYQNGIWYLDYNGNGTWDSTTIDRLYYFGATGWTPEVGDWSGTGTTKIGVYLNGVWYLDYNGNGTWDGSTTDRYYNFGATGWTPVIGDWSGTGTTKIGVYQNGAWYLDYNGNGVWDGPSTDRYYNFGTTGWTSVIGDWNDDGSIEIGVYQNGVWYLDYNGNGAWDGSTIDRYYNFGTTGWTPIIGVWI